MTSNHKRSSSVPADQPSAPLVPDSPNKSTHPFNRLNDQRSSRPKLVSPAPTASATPTPAPISSKTPSSTTPPSTTPPPPLSAAPSPSTTFTLPPSASVSSSQRSLPPTPKADSNAAAPVAIAPPALAPRSPARSPALAPRSPALAPPGPASPVLASTPSPFSRAPDHKHDETSIPLQTLQRNGLVSPRTANSAEELEEMRAWCRDACSDNPMTDAEIQYVLSHYTLGDLSIWTSGCGRAGISEHHSMRLQNYASNQSTNAEKKVWRRMQILLVVAYVLLFACILWWAFAFWWGNEIIAKCAGATFGVSGILGASWGLFLYCVTTPQDPFHKRRVIVANVFIAGAILAIGVGFICPLCQKPVVTCGFDYNEDTMKLVAWINLPTNCYPMSLDIDPWPISGLTMEGNKMTGYFYPNQTRIDYTLQSYTCDYIRTFHPDLRCALKFKDDRAPPKRHQSSSRGLPLLIGGVASFVGGGLFLAVMVTRILRKSMTSPLSASAPVGGVTIETVPNRDPTISESRSYSNSITEVDPLL